jgi:mxaJ protein
MRRALLLLIVAASTAGGCGSPSSSAAREAVSAAPHERGDAPLIGASLRICADPNNLPFSNNRAEGFENRIAELLAHDLGSHVEYVWWAQRRGFLRNTLNAGVCDVVIGMPTTVEMALMTEPYYRSTYVFVSRRDRRLRIHSFDDARLKRLRIGVPMVGDDGASAPPAHALARRGMLMNLVQYSVFGDYGQDSPPSALIAAVARGDIDVAAAWGPLAGYFAARHAEPLEVTPVDAHMDGPFVPFAFDISMAVRRGDTSRKAVLDQFIERRRSEIDGILAEFGVPRIAPDAEESF